MKKTFTCPLASVEFSKNIDTINLVGFNYQVQIDISDPELKSVFTTDDEHYELNLNL